MSDWKYDYDRSKPHRCWIKDESSSRAFLLDTSYLGISPNDICEMLQATERIEALEALLAEAEKALEPLLDALKIVNLIPARQMGKTNLANCIKNAQAALAKIQGAK